MHGIAYVSISLVNVKVHPFRIKINVSKIEVEKWKREKKRTVMQATYPFSFIPYYPASKHCAYGKNNIEIHKFNSLDPGFTQWVLY